MDSKGVIEIRKEIIKERPEVNTKRTNEEGDIENWVS